MPSEGSGAAFGIAPRLDAPTFHARGLPDANHPSASATASPTRVLQPPSTPAADSGPSGNALGLAALALVILGGLGLLVVRSRMGR